MHGTLNHTCRVRETFAATTVIIIGMSLELNIESVSVSMIVPKLVSPMTHGVHFSSCIFFEMK